MNPQVPIVCQPSPTFEGVSPMSATGGVRSSEQMFYVSTSLSQGVPAMPMIQDPYEDSLSLSEDELVSDLLHEYPHDPHIAVVCKRLEQRIEQVGELQQELASLDNESDNFSRAHQEARKEIELFEAVLRSLDLDPKKLWSERYRNAMGIDLPVATDKRQLELNFGGAR